MYLVNPFFWEFNHLLVIHKKQNLEFALEGSHQSLEFPKHPLEKGLMWRSARLIQSSTEFADWIYEIYAFLLSLPYILILQKEVPERSRGLLKNRLRRNQACINVVTKKR